MTLTMSQARDEMCQLFYDGWTAGLQASLPDIANSVIAYTQWPDTPPPEGVTYPPQELTPWARVTILHQTGGQASLSGVSGSSRHQREGIFSVQCFAPVGESAVQAYTLSQIALDSLDRKSTPGGVWFRNVRPADGDDEAWKQVNVLADFTYDEIK